MRQPSELLRFACPACLRATYNPHDITRGFCGHCKTYYPGAPEGFPAMWLVFDHPLDYPEHYVVRVSFGPWSEKRALLCATLEQARHAARCEGACVKLPRYPEDDPKLLEVWI